MLKQLKVKSSQSHEDLFIERYDRLMSQSLHLTEGDRQEARDLLHDAFIQFTLIRPDLEGISNLDGYLFVTLRNLRLSQVRRAAHGTHNPRSLASYDSLELGLRACDLRTQIQVRDELRLICDYAAVRKDSSKAGSVLILRFFHGYYPSETALVLHTPRRVVDNWLVIARREAKLYLENPEGLAFMTQSSSDAAPTSAEKPSSPDIFTELRFRIFQSKRGDCFPREELARRYAAETAIDCEQLAHIVSCSTCLDEVNRILRLPSLSERNPFDVTSRDDRSKGGGGGVSGGGSAPGGGAGPTAAREFVSRSRREAKVTYEHRPEELRFSANGFVVGSLKVDSERSEQTISINLDEKISFVEAFSEQGVRLLLMNVEPPPEGSATQSLDVRFSDDRTLKLALSFGDHWPTLHSVYYDPLLSDSLIGVDEALREESGQLPVATMPLLENQSRLGFRERLVKSFSSLRGRFFDPNFWLRPATITVLLAAMLIGALLFVETPKPAIAPTAAEIIAQAIAHEQTVASTADQILHRTISLEECKASGELISRHRIEVWHSAGKGITARRLFNEQGALVAGDWRRTDGVQTIYHHGTQPQVQLAPEKRTLTVTFDNAWQFSPSAQEFSALSTGDAAMIRLEERSGAYVISLSRDDGRDGLVSVSLTLSHGDLHATAQTVVVRRNGELREFRFVETSFEQRPPATVAPALLEPEPELVKTDRVSGRRGALENIPVSPSLLVPVSPAASAALEVEVLRLLHQAGADMGEQVNVTHSPEGWLHVEALVETDKRKGEILDALSSLKSNPALRIDVTTVGEALKRKPQTRTSSPVLVEDVGTSSNTIPVETDLRAFFNNRGFTNENLDYQVRQFSTRIVVRSRETLNHAWALRRLAQRFSPEQLRSLDADARAKWLALVRGHASALQQGARALRQDLSPVFSSSDSDEVRDETSIKSDDDLVRAIELLFALCSASDQAINSAFAISPDTDKATAIKSPKFWRSMRETEALAARISNGQ
ncbi:MAG TPA: RNA polymerase sigma factor [Pyrinomonadaceae bacterium]|jgi:DNA-directed RNA polymerase specialized sigma24 family protein|nr:RNA polymerase sigma factor [Pyrinomonadaceae bacterium]